MLTVLKRLAEVVAVVGSLAAAGWAVLQPHAEEFIKATVQDQISVLQGQLTKLGEDAKKLQVEAAEAELSRTRSEGDLGSIKLLQKEQTELMHILLERSR